jgi:hypothetical protein
MIFYVCVCVCVVCVHKQVSHGDFYSYIIASRDMNYAGYELLDAAKLFLLGFVSE